MSELLEKFIRDERERFEVKHNNMFALSFSEVNRYFTFLEIILTRYQSTSQALSKNLKQYKVLFSGEGGTMNDQQVKSQEELTEIQQALLLETESFYLFAKILLDKLARALEFYFGQGRSYSLDSHDDLVKNIEGYAG